LALIVDFILFYFILFCSNNSIIIAFLSDVILHLASNDFTSTTGTIFQACLPKAKNLIHLDLSDNDFGDDGMLVLASGLIQSCIKKLILDKNFKVKSKLRHKAINVHFIFIFLFLFFFFKKY